MFIGRENEICSLEELYASNKFQCVIIWGRRRVGKTTLINEFVKNKETIFFTGLDSTEKENLIAFSLALAEQEGLDEEEAVIYDSFIKLFNTIERKSREQRLVLVLDEYPYLAKAYPGISSLLQQLIDSKLNKGKLFLILCGSSMSFMEHQVLGYQSPLYGRRTAQYKLAPFNFYDARKFYSDFSKENLAVAFGITGGIPLYMSFLKDGLSMESNIKNCFLSTKGVMYEETTNLLNQELRTPAIYNAIIGAIANGCSKNSEIANRVGLDRTALTNYLDKLIELGLVEKQSPIGNASTRKTIYELSDTMFKFWYMFIPILRAQIERNRSDLAWQYVEKNMSAYMGHVFEKICVDYLWQNIDDLPFQFQQIGRWWGNNPILKKEEEIDILAISGNNAIICECKWRNELTDVDVLQTLERRALLLNYANQYLYVFSKSGFKQEAVVYAKNKNIKLINFKDM